MDSPSPARALLDSTARRSRALALLQRRVLLRAAPRVRRMGGDYAPLFVGAGAQARWVRCCRSFVTVNAALIVLID